MLTDIRGLLELLDVLTCTSNNQPKALTSLIKVFTKKVPKFCFQATQPDRAKYVEKFAGEAINSMPFFEYCSQPYEMKLKDNK